MTDNTRFRFGRNWQNYAETVDESKIESAVAALQQRLGVRTLDGERFLDVGSGSGLHSLAARRLGAEVVSFDFDPDSVECTRSMRHRFKGEDPHWKVEQGSALDEDYLRGLGTFETVYSWGVLHHTGSMWQALGNVGVPCAAGGRLLVAIYNDQGTTSKVWWHIKRRFNTGTFIERWALLLSIGAVFEGGRMVSRLASGRNPFSTQAREQARGMTVWYDLVDWVGGFPFEVAKPERIFEFYRARNFRLEGMKTCGGGLGCCEYLFRRDD